MKQRFEEIVWNFSIQSRDALEREKEKIEGRQCQESQRKLLDKLTWGRVTRDYCPFL